MQQALSTPKHKNGLTCSFQIAINFLALSVCFGLQPALLSAAENNTNQRQALELLIPPGELFAPVDELSARPLYLDAENPSFSISTEQNPAHYPGADLLPTNAADGSTTTPELTGVAHFGYTLPHHHFLLEYINDHLLRLSLTSTVLPLSYHHFAEIKLASSQNATAASLDLVDTRPKGSSGNALPQPPEKAGQNSSDSNATTKVAGWMRAHDLTFLLFSPAVIYRLPDNTDNKASGFVRSSPIERHTELSPHPTWWQWLKSVQPIATGATSSNTELTVSGWSELQTGLQATELTDELIILGLVVETNNWLHLSVNPQQQDVSLSSADILITGWLGSLLPRYPDFSLSNDVSLNISSLYPYHGWNLGLISPHGPIYGFWGAWEHAAVNGSLALTRHHLMTDLVISVNLLVAEQTAWLQLPPSMRDELLAIADLLFSQAALAMDSAQQALIEQLRQSGHTFSLAN